MHHSEASLSIQHIASGYKKIEIMPNHNYREYICANRPLHPALHCAQVPMPNQVIVKLYIVINHYANVGAFHNSVNDARTTHRLHSIVRGKPRLLRHAHTMKHAVLAE